MEGASPPTTSVTSQSIASAGPSGIVGIVGAGVVGMAAGRSLVRLGHRVAWYDVRPGSALRAAAQVGGIVVEQPDHLAVSDAVVLAAPVGHAEIARPLLTSGVHVVSTSDGHDDVQGLLLLDACATSQDATLVVGAALCPGMSGLLAAYLASLLHEVDEIHVAMHGTGGPACARQHHDALGDTSVAWHDGEWVERTGGSGRELCWFPDPIGAVDCYRAAMPDPVLLHRAFPQVQRISARLSATRRDRLTARLPMLTPPRRSGDLGAVRIEVRGAGPSGERITNIAGAAGRAGNLAGTVAALVADACVAGNVSAGARVLGDDLALAGDLLRGAAALGVALYEYTGVARASTW